MSQEEPETENGDNWFLFYFRAFFLQFNPQGTAKLSLMVSRMVANESTNFFFSLAISFFLI